MLEFLFFPKHSFCRNEDAQFVRQLCKYILVGLCVQQQTGYSREASQLQVFGEILLRKVLVGEMQAKKSPEKGEGRSGCGSGGWGRRSRGGRPSLAVGGGGQRPGGGQHVR